MRKRQYIFRHWVSTLLLKVPRELPPVRPTTLTLYADSGVSRLCQQPSMEVPLNNQIVMPGVPPFEGAEADTRMPGRAVLVEFWIYNAGMSLLRNLNAFAAEQVGVHGPGARPEHCESSAQNPEHDMHPRIVGMREREEDLSQRQHYTRDRCPETGQQQRRCARGDQLQDHVPRKRRRQQTCNPILNCGNRCRRSQEQESGSWPTLRKCREKPLHNRSRSQAIDIRKTSKPPKADSVNPSFEVSRDR
jgi:hypothetical protein